MSELKIFSIEISFNRSDINDIASDINENLSNSGRGYSDYGINFSIQRSRLCNSYAILNVESDGYSDYPFSIAGILEGQDVSFKGDVKLGNMNKSFYTDIDKSMCPGDITGYIPDMLVEFAKRTNGTIAFTYEDIPYIVRDGKQISSNKITQTLSDGVVSYMLKNGETKTNTIYSTQDDEYVYTPQIILDEWINDPENENIKNMVSGAGNIQNKFEMIGAYLVSQKNSNKIDSLHFIDLFKQTCDFIDMYGGFKNPTLNTIANLFIDNDDYDNDNF